MAAHDEKKRNVAYYLKNFATWLNQAAFDPVIAGTIGNHGIRIDVDTDVNNNLTSFTKELQDGLNTFIQTLISSTHHHEKLAKESKKKLESFNYHLRDTLNDHTPTSREATSALNALNKTVTTAIAKVTYFLKQIIDFKHPQEIVKAKGYIDLHHHKPPPTHLKRELKYKEKQNTNAIHPTIGPLKILTTPRKAG